MDHNQREARLPAVIAPIASSAIPMAQLQDEVAQARSYAVASRAASNRRVHEADWTQFAYQCGSGPRSE